MCLSTASSRNLRHILQRCPDVTEHMPEEQEVKDFGDGGQRTEDGGRRTPGREEATAQRQ